MKAISCLPLLIAAFAWADEPADRAAIRRAIAVVNELPWSIPAVAESPTAEWELAALRRSAPPVPNSGQWTVNISHEPWGEATIGPAPMELPRIASGIIRFITPDVALADGDWIGEDGTSLHQPVLFVMKKVGDVWKSVLAPQ